MTLQSVLRQILEIKKMKKRYKIPVIVIGALLGILFMPLIASNLYCDFLGDSCTSRITGVGPGGVYLPAEWGTKENCYVANDNGTMEPCLIDIAMITWPHIQSMRQQYECDEICHDDKKSMPHKGQLELIWDYCHTKDLMGNGKLESDDGTIFVLNSIGYQYHNDTHYIDNNICQWQKLTKFPNSEKHCIPGQSIMSDTKIRNDTHIYNNDKCSWEKEFSWEKENEK